jgi:hypothetical protein
MSTFFGMMRRFSIPGKTHRGAGKSLFPCQPPAAHGNRMAVDAPENLQSEENHMAHEIKRIHALLQKVLKYTNDPFAHWL